MNWFKTCKAETAELGIKDEAKSSDEIMLRQAIIAELDAVNLYEQMAKSTDDEGIRTVMLDIANEEKVHIGEFEKLLEKFDGEHKKKVNEGKKESTEITGENND